MDTVEQTIVIEFIKNNYYALGFASIDDLIGELIKMNGSLSNLDTKNCFDGVRVQPAKRRDIAMCVLKLLDIKISALIKNIKMIEIEECGIILGIISKCARP